MFWRKSYSEKLGLQFAVAPLMCLWLDSSHLPLQRLGAAWLIQTSWDSVLEDLRHCTQGSNKDERVNSHNMVTTKPFPMLWMLHFAQLCLFRGAFSIQKNHSWKCRILSALITVQRFFTSNSVVMNVLLCCPSCPKFLKMVSRIKWD